MRIMFRLPRETHCYLSEPISEQYHMRSLITSRFLGFISRIRNSKKDSVRSMLKAIEYDNRSVTGRNLRKILLQSEEQDINNLKPVQGYTVYRAVPEGEEYRINFIYDLLELRENQQYTNLSMNEIENMLAFLCVS